MLLAGPDADAWCDAAGAAGDEGRLAAVTDTVERVLGRKPIAFERRAEENAAAFR